MMGEWRLFAPALLVWGAALWATVEAGRGMVLTVFAAVAGAASCLLALCGWLLRREKQPRSKSCQDFRLPNNKSVAFYTAPLRYGGVLFAALLLLGLQLVAGWQGRTCQELETARQTGKSMWADVRVTGYPKLEVQSWHRARTEQTFMVRADYACGEFPTPILVRELPAEPFSHLAPGTQLRLRAQITAVNKRQDAFAFNPANAATIRVIEPADPFTNTRERVMRQFAAARTQLVSSARKIAGQQPAAALVPGFAVGDTSLVTATQRTQLSDASLLHLLAVSGANCALVTGACVALAARLGAGRRLRILLAACALVGFCLVVGPDISVLRAALMAAVLLFARFGGIKSRSLPSLGFAMLVLLMCDPWQAGQAGFALSVCATGGILLFAPLLTQATLRLFTWLFQPVTKWLSKPHRSAPVTKKTRRTGSGAWRRHLITQGGQRLLLLPFAVSLAAQLACGPVLLLLTPDINGSGVLANLLAAPAASLGTGLGLLALLTLPLSEPLGMLCLRGSTLAADWVTATATVTNTLPFAKLAWPAGVPGAVLLTALTALGLFACHLWTRKVRLFKLERAQVQPWQKRPKTLASTTILAVSAALTAAGFTSPTVIAPLVQKSSVPAGWIFVSCDVGQGDALLLRDPKTPESVMLVDTGDNPRALQQCCKLFGVTKIALLVLTHDDKDHVGALEAVQHMTAQALISPPTREYLQPSKTAAGTHATANRPLEQQLRAAGIPFTYGNEGMRGRVGNLRFRVLGPETNTVPTESNAASLILLTEQASVRALLLADTNEELQDALHRKYPQLTADILKVAHHGSRDQSPRLINSLHAQIAAVSVGVDNGYGHPVPHTLALLKAAGANIYRTDMLGSFAVFAGAQRQTLRVWAERPLAG